MSAVIAAVVVAAIYFGRTIFEPLAVAILIAFALSPLVSLLRRLHFGRVPSVLVSVLFAVVIMIGLGTFIASQVAGLAADLPRYQTNLSKKIQSIQGTAASSSVVRGATAVLNNIGNQIAATPQAALPTGISSGRANRQPIPVEIRQPRTTPIEVIENVISPLLEPLAGIAIVIVFVGFILLQKEDLRDRFVRLAGYEDLQRTTLALDDAADRLSQYLFSQTAINASFGLVIAGGLWLIGIPNPGLWGLVAGMLRYVPYVGVPIAATFPLALAFAIDPGWSKVLWTAGLFFTCEPVTGQLIEPFVYGRKMGMSAVAVVVAAVFWTWLWGPIGLLLSTPLTMCLVVMGRHVKPLQFLDVLLGDQPPLALEESLYLRMLAGDPDTAALEAEAFLKENSIVEYFDEVATKALALAQRDFDRGVLDRERLAQIRETVHTLIENLTARDEGPAGEEKPCRATPLSEDEVAPHWRDNPILCIAGRTALDEAAATLLAHLLEKHGVGARVIPADGVSPASLAHLDPAGVQVICVSYLDPGNYKNARYLLRRLKKRMPDAHAIAGFWGFAQSDSHYLDSVEAMEMNDVVSSLCQALERILHLARRAADNPPSSAEPEQAAAE
ncbi:MAG TPA: AI-2E family transporter [Rhizomicrobium sp.]|jgi:predicted PurR-regulated permease PerM|nr:AI-2E family transporter [Rhizomicrobium sp.]